MTLQESIERQWQEDLDFEEEINNRQNQHLTNCTPSSPCSTCIAREESLSTKE